MIIDDYKTVNKCSEVYNTVRQHQHKRRQLRVADSESNHGAVLGVITDLITKECVPTCIIAKVYKKRCDSAYQVMTS